MEEQTTSANVRPAMDLAGRYYQGERGDSYFSRQNPGGVAAARYNLWLFEPYVSADDELLDFGCGGGHLLSALQARSRTGVELNPAARRVATSQGLTVFSDLGQIKDRRFDRIVTSHTIEHVGDPLHTLTRLYGLLKPNGLLIWLSPMDDWRSRNQRTWHPDDPDMHLYTWTPLTIGNLLATAGFLPLSVRIVTHAIPPRLHERLWKASPVLFHATARLWSVISKRRQILAVARPAAASTTAAE